MEEQILREILAELKGLRQGQNETNQRLDQTNLQLESLERATNKRFESLELTMNKRFESLELTTNTRFESLELTTNTRFESLEKKFDGVFASLQVLTRGFSDLRIEVQDIRKFLMTVVIWNYDVIEINTNKSEKIEGTIHSKSRPSPTRQA